MSNRLRSKGIILLAFLTVVLAGCVNKKHLVTIDTQKAQLNQAGGRIGELEAGIADQEKKQQEIRTALEKARTENQEMTQAAGVMKARIEALEGQKAELEKAAAASKDVEEKNSKRIKSLNGQISALKKEAVSREEAIAAKESEIASFQTSQAALQEKVSDLEKKLSVLNEEKKALSDEMEQTVAKKNWWVLILIILLAAAILASIIFFVKGRKKVE